MGKSLWLKLLLWISVVTLQNFTHRLKNVKTFQKYCGRGFFWMVRHFHIIGIRPTNSMPCNIKCLKCLRQIRQMIMHCGNYTKSFQYLQIYIAPVFIACKGTKNKYSRKIPNFIPWNSWIIKKKTVPGESTFI